MCQSLNKTDFHARSCGFSLQIVHILSWIASHQGLQGALADGRIPEGAKSLLERVSDSPACQSAFIGGCEMTREILSKATS